MERPSYDVTLQRADGKTNVYMDDAGTLKVGDVTLAYYSPDGEFLRYTEVINPPPNYEYTVDVDARGTIRHGHMLCESERAAQLTVGACSFLLLIWVLFMTKTSLMHLFMIGIFGVVACSCLGTLETMYDRHLYHESATGTQTIRV